MRPDNVFFPVHAVLRALPVSARGWVRKAQVAAFTDWQHNASPNQPGLASRFAQPYGSLGGGLARAPGFYGFAQRRNRLGSRSALANLAAKRRGALRTLPPYLRTGGMARELINRRPKTEQGAGTQPVRTRFSLHARVLPLLARLRGIASIAWVKEPTTYQMTVYKDTVARTGMYQMMVTRAIAKKRISYVARSYADEWAWRPAELKYLQQRLEGNLLRIVRDATTDPRTFAWRSRYADLLRAA